MAPERMRSARGWRASAPPLEGRADTWVAAPRSAIGINAVSGASDLAIRLVMLAACVGGGAVVGVAAAAKPKFGVALVLAIALALVVLRRLEVGALILVTLVPILSGLKRGYPIPSFRITELLTSAVAMMIFLLVRRVRAVPWTRVEWLMAAFCVGGLALGLLDARSLGQHMSFQEYGTLIGPFQFFLLFRSIRIALHSPRWRLLGLRVLLLSSVAVSMLALLQQANVPKVRTFIYNMTGSDALTGTGSGYASFARATGPFPHWTPLAGYLAVMLVVGMSLLLERDCQPLSRRWLYGVVLLDAVALAFTAELSAMIGLAIAVPLIGRLFGQLRKVLRAALVALLALGMVAGPYVASRISNEYTKMAGTNRSSVLPQTIEFRINIWDHQYFPAIAERPVTGYGTVTPSMVVWPATESQYVTILERGGVILMALYAVLMAGLAATGLAIARSTDDPLDRVTGYSVVVLVIILVPMDIVFPYFEDSGMPQALWALIGIMLAGVRGPLPPIGLTRLLSRRSRGNLHPALDRDLIDGELVAQPRQLSEQR